MPEIWLSAAGRGRGRPLGAAAPAGAERRGLCTAESEPVAEAGWLFYRRHLRLQQEGLEKIGRAVQADHARLADWALPASADCVVFNFGYLPGADHRLFTRPASSLPALEAALEILRPGGVLSACLYSGGVNGDEEKKAVTAYLEGLPPERYTVLICRFANRPETAPMPCFVLKH